MDTCAAGTAALVVAAAPELARVTAGGYLLVDGRPLAETAAASDPWNPPTSSIVREVIAAQSCASVSSLSLGELAAGVGELQKRLIDLLASGARIVVADATTEAHLDLLAKAALGLPIVPVDPGPFTKAFLAAKLAGFHRTAPILAVFGSVTRETEEQFQMLSSLPGAAVVAVDAGALLGTGAEVEIQRAVNEIAGLRSADPLILTSAHTREAVLDLGPRPGSVKQPAERAAHQIASGLATIVSRALEGCIEGCINEGSVTIGGIYSTGGAVSEAVAGALGTVAIEIERAVLPFAVLGRLCGGRFAGLPFLSKGGLVGDAQAAVRCVEALREAARAHLPGLTA